MNTTSTQKRIVENKKEKGFNTTDMDMEFDYLRGEVEELAEAYHYDTTEAVAEELADVAIYTLGIAELLGIDLGEAIARKMDVNADRVYVEREDGSMVKLGAVYTPQGDLLGIPFAKIHTDEKGNLGVDTIIDKITEFHGKHTGRRFDISQLDDVILAYINGGLVVTESFKNVARYEEYVEDGDLIMDFLEADIFYSKREEMEFILLYRDAEDGTGDVQYYLTCLSPRNVERLLLRKEMVDALHHGEILHDEECREHFAEKTLWETLFCHDEVYVPARDTTVNEAIANLQRAISTLSRREQEILTMRFGLDGTAPKSPEEIRLMIGFLTVEDVKDIEIMALRKLRSPSRRNLL